MGWRRGKLSRFAVSVLSLVRPRTWVFAAWTFLFAYCMAGEVVLWRALLGVLVCSLTTGVTNLFNAYTDREEDAVNQPIRARQLGEVGLENIVKITIGLYGLVLLLSSLLGTLFFALSLAAVLDSLFYSMPPFRLKRHWLTGMLSFTGVVSFSFAAGWTLAQPITMLPPVFLLASYFFFAYFSFKNIPDYLGDSRFGVKTLMTTHQSYEKGIRISFLLLGSPYALLAALVLLGFLDAAYLACFSVLPALIYIGYATTTARDTARMERLHTYGFLYGVSFLMLLYFVAVPNLVSLALIASAYAFLFIVMKLNVLDSRREVVVGPPAALSR